MLQNTPPRLRRIRRRRLTHRFILTALVLGTGATIVKTIGAASPRDAGCGRTLTVEVQPGDSLWKIAREYSNESVNLVKFEYELADMNHLDNINCLQVGQTLVVVDRRNTR